MKTRIAALLLALSAAVSFSSCESTEKVTVAEVNPEPAAETVTEAAAETEITEAVTKVTKPEVSYDFTGLDSEKSINILSSEKYHIRFRYDYSGEQLYEDVYVDSGNTLVKTKFMNVDYSMLYRDGIQYTMISDIYYAHDDASSDEIGSADYFSGFGYASSGTTVLDGASCRYDEYYQESTDSMTKFIMNDDNELLAIETSDKIMFIEACDDDFSSEEIMCIPDEMEEVNEEDFNRMFLEIVTSNTDSVSDDEYEEDYDSDEIYE